jgi:hypothetical protein
MVAVYILMIGVGTLLIAAALLNWDWLYSECYAHFLSAFIGEFVARWYTGLIGVAIIALTLFYWIRI